MELTRQSRGVDVTDVTNAAVRCILVPLVIKGAFTLQPCDSSRSITFNSQLTRYQHFATYAYEPTRHATKGKSTLTRDEKECEFIRFFFDPRRTPFHSVVYFFLRNIINTFTLHTTCGDSTACTACINNHDNMRRAY